MAKLNMKKIQDNLVNIGLAGAAGGAAAGLAVEKIAPSMNPLVKNGIVLISGAILPELSPKTKFLTGVGAGMAGVAGENLRKHFMGGGVSGVGADSVNNLEDEGWTPMNGMPMDEDPDIAGDGDDEFDVENDEDINGADDDDVLSGVEDPIV